MKNLRLETTDFEVLRPTHLIHARPKLITFSIQPQKLEQNNTAQISGKIERNGFSNDKMFQIGEKLTTKKLPTAKTNACSSRAAKTECTRHDRLVKEGGPKL